MKRELFGTDGIRGKANTHPMTPEIMVKLGKAAAIAFKNGEERPKILIGKDTRISGYILETALTSGLCSMGADVLLVGPLPTPAIAHLTRSFNADAGIVISASHNSAEDNGVKFFSKEGIKLSDEKEEEIEKLVFSDDIKAKHITGKRIGKAYRIEDAKGRYIEFAKNTIDNRSLEGVKLVVDCANGAAYSVGPTIFEELDAEIFVLNNKPDGLNINLDCGALHTETLKEKVKKNKADLGVAFDGDADRVVMVDENGEELSGDHIMSIIALDLLNKNKLNKNKLVATHYSNLALDKLMEKNGAEVVRVKNGDRYVVKEMVDKGYNFGGERSGHIVFGDFNTTGDGIITVLQVLKIMKEKDKKLSELKEVLREFPQVLVNLKIKEKKEFSTMPEVKNEIDKAEKKLEGKGRVFIRYSGTEDIARIMVEGQDEDKIQKIADSIADKIKEEVGE